MKAAAVAIAYLVLSPIVGGMIAAAISFGMHWLSGEAAEPSSGQPWLMIGAMLFFPFGIVVGAVFGLVQAINTIYLAWNGTPE